MYVKAIQNELGVTIHKRDKITEGPHLGRRQEKVEDEHVPNTFYTCMKLSIK